MTKILGLDISAQKTGVAVVSNGKLLKKSFDLIKPSPKKTYGERLTYFKNEIIKLLIKYKPNYVVIEDIYKGPNINTFKILAMFRGVAIQTIYEATGLSPISLMPTDARSILGVGLKKENAFSDIIDKYHLKDFNFDDHNDIVDAIGLASAIHVMIKQGKNVQSLQNSRRRKKRKRSRNKKSI